MIKWFPEKKPERETRRWITKLRGIERRLERQQRQLKRDEQKVMKSIEEAINKNDVSMARQLARDVARNRRMILMLQKLLGQIRGIKFKLEQAQTMQVLSGDLKSLVRTLYQVNRSLRVPMIEVLLDGLGIEMERLDVSMETMGDAFDLTTFEEADDEVADQILEEILANKTAKVAKLLPPIPTDSQDSESNSSEEEIKK